MLLSDFPGGGELKEIFKVEDSKRQLCLKRKFEFLNRATYWI